MAQGGSAGDAIVSKVNLYFSCTKLRDLDVLSKSDPMCVVYSKLGAASREWTRVGRTEMIKDNLNPKVCGRLLQLCACMDHGVHVSSVWIQVW